MTRLLDGVGLSVAAAGMVACGGQMASTSAAGSFPVSQSGASRLTLLSTPTLPSVSYSYSDLAAPIPLHFVRGGPPPGGRGGPFVPPQQPPPNGQQFGPPPNGQQFGPPPNGRGGPPGGPAVNTDNTPPDNRTTDAGATLGRVLFYDRKLSSNDQISCGSCHQQQFGFGDTARFSAGVNGQTARHTMALANSRFYRDGRFFWDERAASLEAQVLQPIQNPVEMGMTLDRLVAKLKATSYYPALFNNAFGSDEVTVDRISLALSQFVRSLVSGESRFDKVFNRDGPPDFQMLSQDEQVGQRIFAGRGQCQQCHVTNALVMDIPHNTGLDATITDVGTGGGRFKAPSLRNVAVRAPYMHDGRFKTLEDVVDFYDHGVQANRNLDPRLRSPDGRVRHLNLSSYEKSALVAYLKTLTDSSFLAAAKFSDPFLARR